MAGSINMMNIDSTLEDRAKTHGSFKEHALVTQELKQVIATYSHGMCYEHAEAIDMIFHKIGRIIAGDPYHKDHWHDIAGYALLAEKVEQEAVSETPSLGHNVPLQQTNDAVPLLRELQERFEKLI